MAWEPSSKLFCPGFDKDVQIIVCIKNKTMNLHRKCSTCIRGTKIAKEFWGIFFPGRRMGKLFCKVDDCFAAATATEYCNKHFLTLEEDEK